MMHSSTISGSIAARRSASATTTAPSWVAVKPLRAPRNLPVGVRTALTMTDSRTADLDALDDAGAEQLAEPLEDDWGGSLHLARPLRAGRIDQQHGPFQPDVRRASERGADRRAPGEADLALGNRCVVQQVTQRHRYDVSERAHRLILSFGSCA